MKVAVVPDSIVDYPVIGGDSGLKDLWRLLVRWVLRLMSLVVTRCWAKVEEEEKKEELAKSGGTLPKQLGAVDQDLLDLVEPCLKKMYLRYQILYQTVVPSGKNTSLKSRRMIL